MKRIDIVKKDNEWRGERNGRAVPGTRAPRKDETVKLTADKAKAAREPVSVKIHKENGRFQEERTYPGKAVHLAARGKATGS